jgi:hypothetical protein
MAWPVRWIVDLFNALAAWYYRRKYGAAARQLGRLPHEGEDGGGFVVVEIDGLAHLHLRQAMKQGYMPYLARLVTRRRLYLARWHCGLPSTTPASQAGILYGNNWDIPGFRWYDKEKQSSIQCKLPGSVRAIQERIAAGRAGLLRGGSSYTNLFDGDARLALFTLSALGRDRLFENVRGLGFLILFSLSLVRLAKIVGLSLWTWLAYAAKQVMALLRPAEPHFTVLGPLLEIFNNIIFREITTFCVLVDVYRGMPAIYAAYTGYDEIAHHFGADSREAFRALRGIDKQIRQIDRIRQIYSRREYDLIVLSDHGMTGALSFRRTYGQTLEQFIAAHTGQDVTPATPQELTEGWSAARVQFMLDEIRALEARPHRALTGRLLRLARRRLERRLAGELLEADWDLSRQGDIVVRSSGSLSHVYLNVTPRPMDLSEVALLYPELLPALVDHSGIGWVVGREGDDVAIMGKSGTLWIGRAGQRLEGESPLAGQADPGWAAEQLARVARFPHSGDLILLGALVSPERSERTEHSEQAECPSGREPVPKRGETVICFEDQVACHGGLGGPQDWPFIAFPREQRLLAQGIYNAEEIYVRLTHHYGRYE